MLSLLMLACAGGGDSSADTAASSEDGVTSSCPSGSLLAVDWVDHDPEQQWYSGTRLIVTPGVARVRGASTDGSSIQLEYDLSGRLLRRVTSEPGGTQSIESFRWDQGLLRDLSLTLGDETTERSYVYNQRIIVQMIDARSLEPVVLYAVSDDGCITGIGSAIDERGDPGLVHRQTCDETNRVDAWSSDLGTSAWGGDWAPDLGATSLFRDGIDGRPTVAMFNAETLWTMAWWPAGQLKERDDVVCGQGFGDSHSYDADGTLITTRTQPCPGSDRVIPEAITTTWSIESCDFEEST